MTPEKMANLHVTSGPDQRPWTEKEYTVFLEDPKTVFVSSDNGFALGTAIFDQAELCMIIVEREYKGQGIGKSILTAFEAKCRAQGAAEIFLEVSQENAAARALYQNCGFAEAGRRKGYYTNAQGAKIDAIVMVKPLK